MNLIFETPIAAVGSLLTDAGILLAVAAMPFVIFAVVVHLLERTIQMRLAGRFGWKSVLWTGWLGTPIHELSHALLCVVFKHRIKDIALFEPDKNSGRLGYVEHTFVKGNWFQELGNVFIGIAPLAGGSIALAVLLWMFYPDAARAAIESSRSDLAADGEAAVGPGGAVDMLTGSIVAVCGGILQWTNLFTIRFWAFIYLVLCIGSHMAPSASDYRGASRGVFLLLSIVAAAVLLPAFFLSDIPLMISRLIAAMAPLYALFGLTILLCCIATALVFLLTSLLPKRYVVR